MFLNTPLPIFRFFLYVIDFLIFEMTQKFTTIVLLKFLIITNKHINLNFMFNSFEIYIA